MSLYTDRVAKGWCGMCGKEPCLDDSPLGAECKEKARQRAAAKRAAKKQTGECVSSGCHNIPESGTRCNSCKAKEAAARQERIIRKKAAGICQQSGCHAKAKPGLTLCQNCIDALSAVSSEHYRRRKDAGLCRFCDNPPATAGGSMCAYHKAKYRDYKLKLKLEVLEAYGGAVCAVCGETDLDLLQLDHVEGGGRQHRRELDTSGGYEFYLRLKSDGFPQIPPMQVLCANHNIKAYADGRRG